ncbi:MAG: NUDIX hydrolase [bacterium]|nr:NUDIX hydrolase [bacterium]MDZ4341439.1 NUDIX hydrolase [Candidatus Binatia bacterium]
MAEEKKILPAVHALIFDDDKFLLIKQIINMDEGELIFWDVPGGKVQHSESPYDALHREVKEETNLDVEIQAPLGMWYFYRVKDSNQIISTLFRCHPLHMNIDLTANPTNERIEEYVWINKQEYMTGQYQPSHPSLFNLIVNAS